jgi:hypothetical protein
VGGASRRAPRHVTDEHLLDNIAGLFSSVEAGEKLVAGGGIFAVQHRRVDQRLLRRPAPGTRQIPGGGARSANVLVDGDLPDQGSTG